MTPFSPLLPRLGHIASTCPGQPHCDQPHCDQVHRARRPAASDPLACIYLRAARWLPIRAPRRPRKARRGLSLTEAILAAMLATLALQGGLQIWNREVIRTAARDEFLLIDRVAAATRAWAARTPQSLIASARGAPQAVTPATLVAAGLWPDAVPMVTRRKRPVQIWIHAPTASDLYILVAAVGALAPPSLPEGDPSTEATGWISPLAPDRVEGPGLSFAIPSLWATSGARPALQPGSGIALRHLNLEADVSPYLHRNPVPGHPELNRMETDLALGGHDILGAGRIEATTLAALSLDASAGRVASLTVSGETSLANATLSGTLRADMVNLTGTLAAPAATIPSLRSDVFTATSATIRSLNITETATADSLTITGNLAASRIQTPLLEVDTLTAGTVTAGQVGATSLTATTGMFTTLRTQTCTGCSASTGTTTPSTPRPPGSSSSNKVAGP